MHSTLSSVDRRWTRRHDLLLASKNQDSFIYNLTPGWALADTPKSNSRGLTWESMPVCPPRFQHRQEVPWLCRPVHRPGRTRRSRLRRKGLRPLVAAANGESLLGIHRWHVVPWCRCASAQVPAFLLAHFHRADYFTAKSLGLPPERHPRRASGGLKPIVDPEQLATKELVQLSNRQQSYTHLHPTVHTARICFLLYCTPSCSVHASIETTLRSLLAQATFLPVSASPVQQVCSLLHRYLRL